MNAIYTWRYTCSKSFSMICGHFVDSVPRPRPFECFLGTPPQCVDDSALCTSLPQIRKRSDYINLSHPDQNQYIKCCIMLQYSSEIQLKINHVAFSDSLKSTCLTVFGLSQVQMLVQS